MKTRPPDGCPGCNGEQVMRFLHERGLHVEQLPAKTGNSADTIACDRCGRVWLLMPHTEDPSKPVA